MDSTVAEMDAAMPELVKRLGLSALGSKVRVEWSAAQEAAFVAGIRLHERNFERIQKEQLPDKTVEQIISYYYNIWKIRYTQDSVDWHNERRLWKAEAEAAEAEAGETTEDAEPEVDAEAEHETPDGADVARR
ncbi:hypothetical protein V8C86DRAFT_2682585 [Haematococcus lacustris]